MPTSRTTLLPAVRSWAALGIALLPARLCGRSGAMSCPRRFVSPVALVVRDSATGAPLAATARGAISTGDATFLLRPVTQSPNEVELRAEGGGPGRYAVRVERDGYRPWVRTDVRVTGGVCGVQESVRVDARLASAP